MASNLFARRRVGVGFLAAVFLAGGTSSIVASMPAQAAVVPNPVLSITVTPPNPRAVDPVRTDVQWCVPDSTAAGDTFEIALPAELTGLPSGFPLRDPNGLLVATATIVGTPAVATFTFTDYVDTHVNVCGTAFFESSLSDTVVPGTHVTLTFVVNHLNSSTPSIDVQPGTTTIGRGSARKGAYFNDPNDECRTVATACLGWYIESQVGPFQSVTIDDAAAAGTTFECSRVTVLLWSVDANGALLRAFDPTAAGTTVSTTCTTASLHVVATNVPAARLVRVLVRATPAQLNPSGGVTFVNSAQVTHVFPNSTVDTDNITARRRTALVGGDANGVQAPATTTTTAPAVTTTTVAGVPVSPAPTTTNAAVLPPVPPTFPTPAPGEELPATGSNGTLLLAGLVTFLAGVSLLVVATRRRPTA